MKEKERPLSNQKVNMQSIKDYCLNYDNTFGSYPNYQWQGQEVFNYILKSIDAEEK